VTQSVKHRLAPTLGATAPWLQTVAVRTPTLPPATHTNVYIVGEGEVAVVDPASPYRDEQEGLEEALRDAGVTVVELILTHHHVDHVSGAARLAKRLGVGVAAHAETAARVAGRVAVTRTISDGEVLRVGGATLRAVHTPGHAPGHLAFVDEGTGAVIAGDMVASVGTIVVPPDDGGDMGLYLASLERLRAERPAALLPAHGPPIAGASAADEKLAFYVKHRLEREGRVVAALGREPRTVAELVPPAYPDVAPAIYPLAAQSLLAHLEKLEREGRAVREADGRWRRAGS
jgi:glyoxylase-like metal-dependent hydrolase (beta-lactamase superfamily II)